MKSVIPRRRLGAVLPVIGVAVALAAAHKPVRANGDPFELHERCATRLAIAITGESASAALLASATPQDAVDSLLADSRFVERFARFANARLNPEPGAVVGEDATYHLTKYVLSNKKPWAELFNGATSVDAQGTVTSDPNGLGYFRSRPWMVRYAGNELGGYRLVAAYRILQNTTGVKLTATTNVAGADLTATGRSAAACKGCHYENWYALDSVAKVLSKRQGMGQNMQFVPPTDGPQQILGGKTIKDDKELVAALVASDHFKVNTCRHAFNFLYGRDENSCEGAVFEKCIDAVTSAGTMQAALAAVAKDASFCQ